jgi:hypothetical protein
VDGCAGDAGGVEAVGETAVEGGAGPRGGALVHADSDTIRTNAKAKRNGIEGSCGCERNLPPPRRNAQLIAAFRGFHPVG